MLKIFDIHIRKVNSSDVMRVIDDVISKKSQIQIATVNNEILLESRKNTKFKEVLLKSFCVADSTGVVAAIKFKYGKRIEKTPGVDLFYDICEQAQKKGWKVFLLGGGRGVAHVAKSKLSDRFPGIDIVGTIDGETICPEANNEIHLEKIKRSQAQIVAVALGAPKQELWIDSNMTATKANVFIGLGGTLDFVSGNIQRAPLSMRRLGFEWLYRLIREPKRLRRIFNALVIFPLTILFDKK